MWFGIGKMYLEKKNLNINLHNNYAHTVCMWTVTSGGRGGKTFKLWVRSSNQTKCESTQREIQETLCSFFKVCSQKKQHPAVKLHISVSKHTLSLSFLDDDKCCLSFFCLFISSHYRPHDLSWCAVNRLIRAWDIHSLTQNIWIN